MRIAWQSVAALVGLVLLVVQLEAAYRYSGDFVAALPTFVALIGLAAFPVMAVCFWSSHRRWAILFGVSAGLMIPFSLPATVGRYAAERESRAMGGAALDAMIKECATGRGTLCRGREAIWRALGSERQGDVGTTYVSWLTGVEGATIRRLGVLGFALGVELAILACFGAAASPGRRRDSVSAKEIALPDEPPPQAKEPRPEAKKSLGRRWLEGYVKRTPDSTVSAAWKEYQGEVSGKRLSKARFVSEYKKLVPGNTYALVA